MFAEEKLINNYSITKMDSIAKLQTFHDNYYIGHIKNCLSRKSSKGREKKCFLNKKLIGCD